MQSFKEGIYSSKTNYQDISVPGQNHLCEVVRCHLRVYGLGLVTLDWTGSIEIFEKVKRTVLNMITGLNDKTYEEKLDVLGLLPLKDKRTKLDLIQTYKIMKGIDKSRSVGLKLTILS